MARTKSSERLTTSWRGLLYLRQERPGSRRDLWLQSLDGQRHVALTDSGRVAAWNRPQVAGALNGASISPDGTRVAYAERQDDLAPAQPWNVLFVVNADGTGRRKLVDLRDRPPPPTGLRAGTFIWSPDGTRLAYVLETPGPGCAALSLHLVDVASAQAQVADFPLSPQVGEAQLLAWSSSRNEIAFASRCGASGEQRLCVLEVSTGKVRARPSEGPSVSPDGVRAFVAATSSAGRRAALLKLDEAFTIEHTLESSGRFTWYHQHPGGLFTEVTPERATTECAGVTPPPQRLSRWEPGTRARQPVRQDATAFTVLAFSPDDTQALVSILAGRDDTQAGFCGEGWLQRLHLVRREDLESELPREQLLARSVALAKAQPWPGPGNARYLGWLR
ncbi:TolB family protein [Corallococcus silvisoli]|uniref:TolB family protein n=1 Tax=Corallococcus silvisoli TaxID=2697031 RepID=UPI001376A52D|nr:PD40 domain-containing protein [Corallococcus silvisoli]NBD10193.1 hypothetical protein [Corallococcus silvisoli]